MIEIVVSRVAGKGNFRQVATFEGKILGKGKTPFFEACRALISGGYDPEEMVAMRWEGNNNLSFFGRLGTYAEKSVQENDRFGPRIIKYSPFPNKYYECWD